MRWTFLHRPLQPASRAERQTRSLNDNLSHAMFIVSKGHARNRLIFEASWPPARADGTAAIALGRCRL